MSYLSDLAAQQQQRYQQQIDTLRGSLLGVSSGASLNKAADEKYLEYLSQVKTMSLTQQAEVAIRGKIQGNKTKDYYEKIAEFTKKQDEETKDPLKAEILKYNDNHSSLQPLSDKITGNWRLPTPGKDVVGHNGELANYFNTYDQFAQPNGQGGSNIVTKSWLNPDGTPDENTSTSPSNPMTDKLNAMLEEQRKQTPGSYKFFIEKLHGKSASGSLYKKNPIRPGQQRDEIPNRMIFPGYIINYNDSYDVSWADYKFIGRGEKVYVYEETTRSLALEFYMMSDFSAGLLIQAAADYEAFTKKIKGPGTLNTQKNKSLTPKEILKEFQRLLPDWGNGTFPDSSFIRSQMAGFIGGQYSGTPEQIWARRTFLAQCCYAWYRQDGKLKEQPFVRVRIGDFLDVIAKIDGLDFTTEEFDMDLNPSIVGAQPMGMRVVMRMTIIHEDEPTSEYPRFYHRKDFDDADMNPYELPDNMKESSLTLDSFLDSLPSTTQPSKPQVKIPTEIVGIQETLKTFKLSEAALVNSKSNLKDLTKVEKIKAALKNSLKLAKMRALAEIEKVKDLKSAVIDVGKGMVKKNKTSLSNISYEDAFSKGTVALKTKDPLTLGESLFPEFKNNNSDAIGQVTKLFKNNNSDAIGQVTKLFG